MATSLIALVRQEFISSTKKKAVKPLVSILGLWALEKLLENSRYYNCPEEGYGLYGGMFLFGPALCLSTLTLMSSKSFWDSVTSCFRGKVDRVDVCRTTCHALIKSALVGFMWLILAFATTDYFVCFRVGGNRSKNSSEAIKMQNLSSVLAWLMLLISIALALLYHVIEKCCFSKSRKSTGTIIRDYERIEAEAAISTFKKEAKALAKREGERKVNAILHEVNDGKTALEVVEEAKKWLIDRYSRSNKVKKDYQVNDVQLDEIEVETNLLDTTACDIERH
jgi:hypothetical protein